MTDDERDAYGRFLWGARVEQTSPDALGWDDVSFPVKIVFSDVAERFVNAAALVPLDEVRALVQDERDQYIDQDDRPDVASGCTAVLMALNERFGEENNDART